MPARSTGWSFIPRSRSFRNGTDLPPRREGLGCRCHGFPRSHSRRRHPSRRSPFGFVITKTTGTEADLRNPIGRIYRAHGRAPYFWKASAFRTIPVREARVPVARTACWVSCCRSLGFPGNEDVTGMSGVNLRPDLDEYQAVIDQGAGRDRPASGRGQEFASDYYHKNRLFLPSNARFSLIRVNQGIGGAVVESSHVRPRVGSCCTHEKLDA